MSMRQAFKGKDKPKIKGLGGKGLAKGLSGGQGLAGKTSTKQETKPAATSVPASSAAAETPKPKKETASTVSSLFITCK